MPPPVIKSQINHLSCTSAGSRKEKIYLLSHSLRPPFCLLYQFQNSFIPFFQFRFCLPLPMDCLAQDVTLAISRFHFMHSIL